MSKKGKVINFEKPTMNEKEAVVNESQTNEAQVSNEQSNIPQMPEVRAIPRWESNADVLVKGIEWEAIQNSVAQFQNAMQAIQAVMSRNIVEGVIILDYEKLDPNTLQYVEMTDEEKAPYVESSKTQIEGIKAMMEDQKKK